MAAPADNRGRLAPGAADGRKVDLEPVGGDGVADLQEHIRGPGGEALLCRKRSRRWRFRPYPTRVTWVAPVDFDGGRIHRAPPPPLARRIENPTVKGDAGS